MILYCYDCDKPRSLFMGFICWLKAHKYYFGKP